MERIGLISNSFPVTTAVDTIYKATLGRLAGAESLWWTCMSSSGARTGSLSRVEDHNVEFLMDLSRAFLKARFAGEAMLSTQEAFAKMDWSKYHEPTEARVEVGG